MYGIKWVKDIDSRLGEIFMIPQKAFAGLWVINVADLLQLSLVRGKLTSSQISDKDSLKHF